MRPIVYITILLLLIMVGCARSTPIVPALGNDTPGSHLTARNPDPSDHNRKLWAYGLIKVNNDHTRFDWVPLRSADFHLNAVNLLENGACYDCVSIKNITPQGNGVVDVDIGIRHPFPGLLRYTGFDVKGIIMFDGSIEITHDEKYKLFYLHPELFPLRFNLGCAGDWELLNEDGFSFRWTPTYISGQDLPIFNYVEGKLSSGYPDSLINAYKAFYTHEERRMFVPGNEVVCTYRIQTQPGAATLGYAVEACWEPPLVTPVIDPLNDFPISANQSEPYIERYYVNDDQPITVPHTEIYEYTLWVQYREWPVAPGNNDTGQHKPITYIKGEWHIPPWHPNGSAFPWLFGPHPGSDDIYSYGCYPCESFSPFGKYNGYYIWLRTSWHEVSSFNVSNFSPSIQVVQVDIPGNDKP